MRIESSVTSVSWIPREAIEGLPSLPFGIGATHYDLPPPDVLEDLEALNRAGAYRFANRLSAWIESDGERITSYGQSGRGYMSVTKVKLGITGITFPPVAYPDLRPPPEVGERAVRFVQTAGGRTTLPAPRIVEDRRFVRISAPPAWTTVALTLHADGSVERSLTGASPFPRHWLYDHEGVLVQKTGIIDFQEWYRRAFDLRTPWVQHDTTPRVVEAESDIERQLSRAIIDSEPRFVRLSPGETLVEQGDVGTDVFLLFDGVLEVERDGEVLVEVGPGAIVGEMALLDESRRRSATLRATTTCRVAVMEGARIDLDALAQVADHRRSGD